MDLGKSASGLKRAMNAVKEMWDKWDTVLQESTIYLGRNYCIHLLRRERGLQTERFGNSMKKFQKII